MSCRDYPTRPPIPPKPPGPPPVPPPPTTGFVLSVSDYGAVSHQPDSLWQTDMTFFAASKYAVVRIWVDWPENRVHDGRVVNADGSLNSGHAERLGRILTGMSALGLQADLTSAGVHVYNGSLGAMTAGLSAFAQKFSTFTNVFQMDVANEFEDEGFYGSGRSVTELAGLTRAVKAQAPKWRITASTSGDSTGIANRYRDLIAAGGNVEVLCPHFQRTDDWGSKVYERTINVRTILAGAGIVRPIFLQEENRDTEPGWSQSQSTLAAQGAKKAGAIGYCFHTDAGFDQRGWLPTIRPEEKSAFLALPAAVAGVTAASSGASGLRGRRVGR